MFHLFCILLPLKEILDMLIRRRKRKLSDYTVESDRLVIKNICKMHIKLVFDDYNDY